MAANFISSNQARPSQVVSNENRAQVYEKLKKKV